MTRLFSIVLLGVAVLSAAHTTESAGQPPADLKPEFASLLQKDGLKVLDGKRVVSEIWFRSSAPTGPKTGEENVSLTTVPHGSLIGVMRLAERGSDRRGQPIKPGVYTLRLSYFPPNG
ncbi:MAG TPA: hypothetical protein VEQ63_00030, partial [Bryobacteraceae bacterium]|nr:hypothetical protein [Bryobacteraceae bacterium]